MREQELKLMYREVEDYFRHNHLIDPKVKYKFTPGSWIKSVDGFEYRFDICKKCGRRYVNKRPRGIQYGVHHWWHYCTKGICRDCHPDGKNLPPSLKYESIIKL